MIIALKYIILGVIQGLTEFLPVSSSAHLVIFQDWFRIDQNQLLFDIILHLGTLAAVVVFLFQDIKRLCSLRMIGLLLSVTALTAAVVILGGDVFEQMFLSSKSVSLPLIITGVILLGTKRFNKGARGSDQLKFSDACWLGIIQGLAVIPGISRSGSTIAILMFRDVQREVAFKISFLASILAILGALVLKFDDFSTISVAEAKYMVLGFFAAFFSGLIAMKILLEVIRKARLYLFGYYCLVLALLLLIIQNLKV